MDLPFAIGSDATPKRPRPSSASASRPAHFSSSPVHGQNTPQHRPTPGPSRLNGGSSPAGFPSPATPASPSAPVVPFATRQNKLTIQETLNSHLSLPTSAQMAGNTSRVALAASTNPQDYNYRIGYERSMERSEVLDKLIDDAAEIFREYYGIEEFGDPSMQSQEDILVVGRLCPETDTAKMTETSTWLESSRMLGSGSRVLLKFEPGMKVRGAPSGSGGTGMFPGCIVGLKGMNGGGKLFAVKEVLMMPPADATYTSPSELLSHQYGDDPKELGGNPMSVLVASGPYTVDSDLEYEPLQALLELAQGEKPDVVILTGPFIDASHPLIQRGEIDEFPPALFRSRISSKLAALVSASPRTAVILIPNGRDLISSHYAFPQAPFTKDPELGLPKGVRLLPNPCQFSINEVVFGVASVDVLWALKSQEFFRKCGDAEPPAEGAQDDPLAKDVMARVGRHLLRQRSFYPVFPSPPPSKMLDQLNLDITHYDLVKMGKDGGPDIVIAPSIQKHFTRIVDSTVILNPSFLTKSSAPASAGTFARLTIHPMDRESLTELMESGNVDAGGVADDPVEHRVWERCRVDVIKV
ncbi:DNA-directed DNA polymerase alpha subunit pol12 [Rhodosporidiobolus nylandii]